MYTFRYGILLSSLLLLSACGPFRIKTKRIQLDAQGKMHAEPSAQIPVQDELQQEMDVVSCQQNQTPEALLAQLEAQLIDIPVPLSSEPVFFDGFMCQTVEQGMLRYRAPLSIAELILWYSDQMELLGWQKVCVIEQDAFKYALFEKPTRVCTLSLEQTKNKSYPATIALIYGQKLL